MCIVTQPPIRGGPPIVSQYLNTLTHQCILTDMDYTRKNITLPNHLKDRLSKEGNQSATIAEALNLYYRSKDAAKKLVQLVDDFEGSFDYLDEHLKDIKRDVRLIKEKAGVT